MKINYYDAEDFDITEERTDAMIEQEQTIAVCDEPSLPWTDNNEPTHDASDVVNAKDWFDPLDFSPEAMERAERYFIMAERAPFVALPDNAPTTIIKTKKTFEVISYTNQSNGAGFKHIENLPGGKFLNKKTGEIKYKKKNENRVQNNAFLNKSIKAVRRLIDNNFEDGVGQFVTLCYDYAMTDYKQAKADLVNVVDGLRYRKLDYIWVIEPKESGSWHYHILIKPREGHTFTLTEDEVRKMWKNRGSVDVQPITNVDGLAAYLGRASQTAEDEEEEENGITMLADKKYTYSRRSFYKTDMRLYGYSQSLEKPTRIKTTKAGAAKMVEGCERIGKPKSTIISKKNATKTYPLNAVSYEEYRNK